LDIVIDGVEPTPVKLESSMEGIFSSKLNSTNTDSTISIMKYSLHKLLLILGAGLLLWACEKDDDQEVHQNDQNNNTNGDEKPFDHGAFILNEGNFNQGNASLDFWDSDQQKLRSQVFKEVNGRPLGDVLHAMNTIDGHSYLIVNNSGKIEVINPATLESQQLMNGFPSPRRILKVADGKAYVTNFTLEGASEISIVDLQDHAISGSIAVDGWKERLVKANNKVFVSQVKAGNLLVIDPKEDAIMDTISLVKEVKHVAKDANGNLWALGNGGFEAKTPRLYKIDPLTHEVLMELEFGSKQTSPGNLTLNAAKDSLFFLNEGVFTMPIQSTSLPSSPVIREKDYSFYSIGVAPTGSEIYVSDAIDYVQKGMVLRFNRNDGKLIDSFRTGIIPGGFVFRE